jgi:hypothetical protein
MKPLNSVLQTLYFGEHAISLYSVEKNCLFPNVFQTLFILSKTQFKTFLIELNFVNSLNFVDTEIEKTYASSFINEIMPFYITFVKKNSLKNDSFFSFILRNWNCLSVSTIRLIVENISIFSEINQNIICTIFHPIYFFDDNIDPALFLSICNNLCQHWYQMSMPLDKNFIVNNSQILIIKKFLIYFIDLWPNLAIQWQGNKYFFNTYSIIFKELINLIYSLQKIFPTEYINIVKIIKFNPFVMYVKNNIDNKNDDIFLKFFQDDYFSTCNHILSLHKNYLKNGAIQDIIKKTISIYKIPYFLDKNYIKNLTSDNQFFDKYLIILETYHYTQSNTNNTIKDNIIIFNETLKNIYANFKTSVNINNIENEIYNKFIYTQILQYDLNNTLLLFPTLKNKEKRKTKI